MGGKKGRDGTSGVAGLRDGRLSYGAPISVDGRTVIPVTRVRVQRAGDSRTVDSSPLGYIEVTSDGSAFHPIEARPDGAAALRVAAAAVTTIAGVLAGARALRSARRSPRLLPAGRPRLHR